MPVGFFKLEIQPNSVPKGPSTAQLSFQGSVTTSFENPVHFKLTLITHDPVYPNSNNTYTTEWDDNLSVGVDKLYSKSVFFSNQSTGGSCRVQLDATDKRSGQWSDNTHINY